MDSIDLTNLPVIPLVQLIAGIIILIVPRLLNYIVALSLIIVGLLGLFPQLASQLPPGVVPG
jgi:hypothetical protein